MRQRRGHRSLGQRRAERFALVQAERGDVDQARDIGVIRAERGDDLAAVGVPGDDGGAVLQVQHLAQPGNVIGERGQRELRRGDVVAVGLQALDDAAPAGALGPGAVDEDDVRSGVHLGSLRSRFLLPSCEPGPGQGIRSITALCGRLCGSRQACRRCGVMIRASGNIAANRDAVPNSAPMRSEYLITYSGTWSAAGNPETCPAVQSMRMMSRPMSVTSSPRATLGLWLMLRSFIFAAWL